MSEIPAIDPNTIEMVKAMGVEVDNWKPIVVPEKQYTLEEIKEFLQNANIEPKPEEPKPEEPKPEEPITTPNPNEEPKGDSFEQILNELEELNKERSDAAAAAQETKDKLDEKVQEVKDWTATSETIKEIVQLNAKLQTELEVYKNTDVANKAKIKELSDKVNYYELDDSRLSVPSQIKKMVEQFINYETSKNEDFKIKAMLEMARTLEQLGWGRIEDYIDNEVIKKKLSAIASLSGDPAPISIKEQKEESPEYKFAQVHWVPKEL